MQPTIRIRQDYTARLARCTAECEARERSQARLGSLRLWAALAMVGVAAAALGALLISAWWLVVPTVALVVLIVLHAPRERALRRARRVRAFYERALARVEDRWVGTGSQGEALRDPQHGYADDLDVFGRGSLFELLSTARTATGERTLAAWLLAPAAIDEVRARQDAVRELAPQLELREDLAVLGEDIRAALDDRRLAAWGAAAPVRFWAGAQWVALLLALVAAVAVAGWATDRVTLRPFLYVAVVEMVFWWSMRGQVEAVTSGVNTPARELGVVAVLLERLEQEQFASPALRALSERLRVNGRVASQQIHGLRRLVEWKEWAHNQVFGVIAAPLLWVPQFAMAIERWRMECGPHVADWIAAVGEFEALGSLAAFAHERPEAVFADLVEGDVPVYQATAVAHPLLAAGVPNDVVLTRETPLWIISGSNMAGKSTLMRAVGLSVVMAWSGAPVTAGALRLSRLRIGASMRASDSLADHQSRFYAEIRKLKAVVDAAGSGEPTLFLLDELLSGTNSHDRRVGAEGLIRGLLERGAIGLATTHDLALAEIAESMGGGARNVHFADLFDSGKIAWDYKLRPGVVQKGNALELMRAVGLHV